MPTTTVITLQFLSQRLKLRSLSQRWVVNESLCDNIETWPIATIDESETEINKRFDLLWARLVIEKCLLRCNIPAQIVPVNQRSFNDNSP
jgi:hypothetical protein